MTIMTAAALVTPDELLKLPDAVNYELTDGKLVDRHMGMESSRIGDGGSSGISRLLQAK